jgi:hypothetical protein
MTARAGDALPHVYFGGPPRQFSKPIFKPISKAISKAILKAILKRRFNANQPPRFCRLHPHPNARQFQAQWFRPYLHGRHEPPEQVESGSPPFTCRDFVNTIEHFIHQ